MDIHATFSSTLPHRYPFLLVDRVLECVPGESLTRSRTSPSTNRSSRALPNRPVMPGVLILEALAQATGLLAFATADDSADDHGLYYFVGIDKRAVPQAGGSRRPVDRWRSSCCAFARYRKFAARALVDGEVVCEGELMCAKRGSSPVIDPRAVIDPGAELGSGVTVGPFSVIGDGVVRSAMDARIGPHVVIQGPTRIGRNNTIHSHTVLGGDPQDKKWGGETTSLEIGDDNTIFQFCTVSRGTVQDAGVTRIGNDNWIMAYVHIAHDCQVSNHTILANATTLAGHVHVDDWAILGGFSKVHQFCHVGIHAFCGMDSGDYPGCAALCHRLWPSRRPARAEHGRAEAAWIRRGPAAQHQARLPLVVP
jgi:3-hydroxymyristoyl/3-hydroxydecanoyl-(acyl carrier protein) dehydratase/carbonic anhydrase/acetyltransferase-like protein (isoleucine patch superfamily)